MVSIVCAGVPCFISGILNDLRFWGKCSQGIADSRLMVPFRPFGFFWMLLGFNSVSFSFWFPLCRFISLGFRFGIFGPISQATRFGFGFQALVLENNGVFHPGTPPNRDPNHQEADQ